MCEPFLKVLASAETKELKERITEKIFHPLLENNKTVQNDEDEEELAKREHYYRHVDGGKLKPST